MRPLGLANAVTQGKGSDLATAAISAVMEAAEQFFAERVDRFRTVMASAEGLGAGVGHWSRMSCRTRGKTGPALKLPGFGRLMISRAEKRLPLELVHTAYVEPGLPTDGLFFGSTTGSPAHFPSATHCCTPSSNASTRCHREGSSARTAPLSDTASTWTPGR